MTPFLFSALDNNFRGKALKPAIIEDSEKFSECKIIIDDLNKTIDIDSTVSCEPYFCFFQIIYLDLFKLINIQCSIIGNG